ncbi:hypothetical protein ONE63_006170 [Megalurothrips usitatus]|uniref:50S ribosomal protein L1 n=1 Tax=Megalurothrips usitatus TaxID=439358 RepID=A0AAV7XSI6_9NEOP|nr:hypothetical protein ONE63_006170 [Megalurothrips usitatus]
MCPNIGLILRLSGALNISTRSCFLPISSSFLSPSPALVQTAIRNYAARKGTRTRKVKQSAANKAAKKNKEEALSPYLQKQMMAKMKSGQQKPLLPDDSDREIATDNVFFSGVYKWPVYDVITAIDYCKESHHPTMFDNPTAVIKAYFELDLSTKKKTQFLENVSGVVEFPHYFETGKPIKSVCVICKDLELNKKAAEAGAEAVVGLEGVKMFQVGDLDIEDYDVILAHPDVLTELAPIRGLIGLKKFPNIKKGTVGFDLASMVKKFKNGVDYKVDASPLDPKLGMLQVPIGTVAMKSEEMVANFGQIVEAVLTHKPAGVPNDFISKYVMVFNRLYLVLLFSKYYP